ncbi:uncharacterized protein LOC123443723 isoform X2 [Hordeum vulgare subsp. vulgare]|uniref:Predicted protein n=1 Tax=Hordeum vulgare subsp. vulgare TaxID=112509 RepID=F2EFU1_HORVV|nr:uncharacterized protein LOC123443723 isoform X2 [Hordeum vulgare subsp. vulgare]XP_044976160.1 uncharacterized protein LOC123443723 isoform X2 [Hordeum vulgare subsp. vulgare]BAK06213.1 predicted protein [Hordeum vulgare subsp. vulgare]
MEPAVRVELEGLGEDNCREGLCRRPSPHPLRPLLEAQFEREAMAGPDSWWIWRTRPRSGGICQRRRRPGRHPAGGIRRPQIRVSGEERACGQIGRGRASRREAGGVRCRCRCVLCSVLRTSPS